MAARIINIKYMIQQTESSFSFDYYCCTTIQVSEGYYNWKNATAAFQKHQQSSCHREAVDAMITLPNTTIDIGEQLVKQHAKEKECN